MRSDKKKYGSKIQEIQPKYDPNTVWYVGIKKGPQTITLDPDLQIHFPMWHFESTDWAGSSQVVGNTEIHFGNTRNTPKYSLRWAPDEFSVVRNFWTKGRFRPLEKAKSVRIEFAKWWEQFLIDQGNTMGGGGWLMMVIRGVSDQFQGDLALPGSAGEPVTLTVARYNWQLLARWTGFKHWYTICMDSLSPEVESPNLKNGRMLRGWLRIYSLMKI